MLDPMRFLDLFSVASMPVLKVLLITALGSFLALDRVNLLGENARAQFNRVVFFVFSPALVGSSLAKTITSESIVLLWFMPFNIILIFIVGSALGWLLVKVTGSPQHLKGLIIGCCAAGNMGNLPLIIIPAICKEKGSPFGAPDVCHSSGIAYASLSMAIGAIYLWSYVYNILRISSSELNKEADDNDNDEFITDLTTGGGTPKLSQKGYSDSLLPSKEQPICAELTHALLLSQKNPGGLLEMGHRVKEFLRKGAGKLNLKALFAPSTIGAIVGFFVGVVSPIRHSLIGATAPLRVVEDSASMLGDAAIPAITLIMGANLLRGLKESSIRMSIIVGILAVRYVLLPLLGIVIVKGAVRYGLVHPDSLYQFILLLQYALPPAMNIGTMTQLFGAGEKECSVILLWTYAVASLTLTLWSTLFMWLVA